MEITGNLHDLGKLIVPNSILEKQDKLTAEEFSVMKQHSYFTYVVLSTVRGLEEIAESAAFHHEKLDGSGYPFHLTYRKLNMLSRILGVADIFTALLEDRPYRAGMQMTEAMGIIKDMAEKGALDMKVVNVLEENLDDIADETKRRQAYVREYYEKVFRPA
jgi:HD-GYP domain-containing protein (c-di-GMP phosphodiesterase class II)